MVQNFMFLVICDHICQKNFPSYCEILSFNISMQGANTLSNLTKKEILVSQIRSSELINLKLNMDMNQVSDGYQTRIGIASLLRLSLIPTKHDTSKVLKPAIILQDDLNLYNNWCNSVVTINWPGTIELDALEATLGWDSGTSWNVKQQWHLTKILSLAKYFNFFWIINWEVWYNSFSKKKIFVKTRLTNFMRN